MGREIVEEAMDSMVEWAGPVPEVIVNVTDQQNQRRTVVARRIIETTLDSASEENAVVLAVLANRINHGLHSTLERLVGIQTPFNGNTVFRFKYKTRPDTGLSLCMDEEVSIVRAKSTGVVWKGRDHFGPSIEDCKHAYGIDLEADAIKAVADAVVAETTKDILQSILNYAPRCDGREWIAKFRNAMNHEDRVECAKNFACIINRAGSDIARKTRRGAGNVLVCTPEVFEILSLVPPFVTTMKLPIALEPNMLYRAATLRNGMEVFVCLLPTDDVIVAYHGISAVDVGYVLTIDNLAYVEEADGMLKYTTNTNGFYDKEFYNVIQY